MELIRVLRQLADDRGITVVAVVHQPSFSLFSLFDSIVLLCKGGRVAYSGPVKAMKAYFEELGFQFPSSENAVDVCLDAVSGLRSSTNPDVTVASIPEIWLKRQGATAPSDGSVQGLEPDNSPLLRDHDESDDGPNVVEELEQPVEQRLPDAVGVRRDFWRMALICFLFPPFSLVSFYSTRFRSRMSQLGAVIGSSIMMLLSMSSMFWALNSLGFSPVGLFFRIYALTFGSLNILLGVVAVIAAVASHYRLFSLAVLAHFQMAVALGPLLLPAVFLFREKLRYAARLGIGLWMVGFGVVCGTAFIILSFQAHVINSTFAVSASLLWAEAFLLFFPTIGLSLIAVSAFRWNHLPSSDRLIATFPAQAWFQFVRSFRQYTRDVFGVGLDLILPMFTGFATGVLVSALWFLVCFET